VFVLADDRGQLAQDTQGRVEIRYKAEDGRAYRAAVRNLEPIVAAELLPDSACAPAQDATSARVGNAGNTGKTAKTSKTKAGSKSAAAAAVAARVLPQDAIVVYADGACSGNPGPAGIGVVVQDGAQRRELSQYLGRGTNNIAELTAILEAAVVIEGLGLAQRPVRIHTDSRYSIGVLSLGWQPKANQDLVKRVKQALRKLSDVELIHVPGHAGVPLNERADALAVQAVKGASSTGWLSSDSE